MARKAIRWLLWLPLAIAASAAASGAAASFSEFSGGSAWYVWLVSGAVSAWAFFYVALRVAPATSALVKWTSVFVVGAIGLMAALGELMKATEPIRALQGGTMLFLAVCYARLPTSAVKAEVGLASNERSAEKAA